MNPNVILILEFQNAPTIHGFLKPALRAGFCRTEYEEGLWQVWSLGQSMGACEVLWQCWSSHLLTQLQQAEDGSAS